MRCTPIAAVAASVLVTATALSQPASTARRGAATACTSATPTCTEWVVLAGGPGRSLVYRSHPLDTRNEALTRVLVSIHGAGRNADDYFSTTLAAAFLAGGLENTLVIA